MTMMMTFLSTKTKNQTIWKAMVNPRDPHTSTISIGPEVSRKRKSCEEKTRLNTSATSPANPPKASRRWSKTSFVAAKTANMVNVIGILRKNPPTKKNTKKKKTKPKIYRRNLQP